MTGAGDEPRFDFARYDAAVFDLDGTLVHSEPAWEAAKVSVAENYGYTPSRELLDAHIGRGLRDFIDELFDQPLSPEERRRIGDEMGATADVFLPKMRAPIPGAAELLCDLHDQGMRIAICSSSPRRHIRDALEMLGVADRVETIVSATELSRGKPDPLPYTATADALGLTPSKACAFEDSLPGARSAFAAGLAVLAVGESCLGPEFSFCRLRAKSFEKLMGKWKMSGES